MDQVIAPSPGDPLAGVPELRSYLTRDEREKTEALKLVSDGVAQMRPIADKALIFHPLNLIVLAGILALIYWFMVDSRLDRVSIGAAGTFLLVVALAGVRLLTQGYLWNAEDIDRDWLGSADVIVTKFGNDLIGAVVLDWVSGESRQKRKRAWRGEIRAWTVHKRYRNKGVGASLLEEAVRESRRKGAESIAFADDHASESTCISALVVIGFAFADSDVQILNVSCQACTIAPSMCARVGLETCSGIYRKSVPEGIGGGEVAAMEVEVAMAALVKNIVSATEANARQ